MDALFNLESVDKFCKVLEDVVSGLHDPKKTPTCGIRLEEFMLIKEEIKKLITEYDYDTNKIAEILLNKSLDQEKVDRFGSILDKNKTDVVSGALLQHNSVLGDTVINFNCLTKLVLGINEFKALRYPLLQLLFSTLNSSGEQKQTVYEFDKEMLEKLISTLENMNIDNT